MPAKTTEAGSSHASGSCLCGAVQFSIDTPPKWVAHCHCTMCRRAHGAPFVTWVGVEAGGFHLVKGEARGRYQSSAEATREFCSTCGSPLFFRSTRWPGEVHIARAAFPGDVGKEPAAHVFYADKATWVHEPNDGLVRK